MPDNCPRNGLAQIYPRSITEKLLRMRGETLGAYARAMYAPERAAPRSAAVATSRQIFRDAITSRLSVDSIDDAEIRRIDAEIESGLTIQTGPHCQLITDPDTLATLHLACIGVKSRGVRTLFWYCCSTVNLKTRALSGPGWAVVNGHPVNLFRLSQRALSRTSVCGHVGGTRFSPTLNNEKTLRSQRTKSLIEELTVLLPQGSFESPADAFIAANARLWAAACASKPRLVMIDDSLAGKMVCAHLRDECSVLSKMLFCSRRRNNLLDTIAVERRSIPDGALRWSTDFFWSLRERRIRSLRLDGNVLVEPETPDGFIVPFQQKRIIEELEGGALIPNLFLVFVVLGLLPRFRVAGGPRQLIYYPAFFRAFISNLDGTNSCEAALRADLGENADHDWSMYALDSSFVTPVPPFGPSFHSEGERLSKLSLELASLDFAALREAGT